MARSRDLILSEFMKEFKDEMEIAKQKKIKALKVSDTQALQQLSEKNSTIEEEEAAEQK